MSKYFNLLDERWVSVCMSDGRLREVGLLELFEQAGQIRSLAEISPSSVIALYRLLLVITHRALSRLPDGWKDRDRAEWYRTGLPQNELRGYLEQWRDRFWLFHPESPFMQVAVLATAIETRNNLKAWTQISLASSTGNAPVLFDHSVDSKSIGIEQALALRTLLGFLQFAPEGLVQAVRDSDKAGPLANSAASVPIGKTLNETLCLALHPKSRVGNDIPSWEQPPPSVKDLKAGPLPATGENDRYTRLSRAVLFLRNQDGRIKNIHFAAGLALAEDVNAPDPMVCYRAGREKLVRLSFRDGRAFWRDLPALAPDAEGKASHPAAVLGWAVNLKAILGEVSVHQEILVAGVTSKQAKVLRWRIEQIGLPVALLEDANLARYLRDEMQRAEEVFGKLLAIGTDMLADTMPDPNRKETRKRARTALDTGPSAATFFATIESDMPRLLEMIAALQIEEAQALWSEAIQKATSITWNMFRNEMGRSPSALRAEARAYPRFCALRRSLRQEMAPTDISNEVQA